MQDGSSGETEVLYQLIVMPDDQRRFAPSTHICFPPQMSRCCAGGMPSFSSTRSLMRVICGVSARRAASAHLVGPVHIDFNHWHVSARATRRPAPFPVSVLTLISMLGVPIEVGDDYHVRTPSTSAVVRPRRAGVAQ